jgi:hypothetical protein
MMIGMPSSLASSLIERLMSETSCWRPSSPRRLGPPVMSWT